MMNQKLRVAAGHYHLFHRVAPIILDEEKIARRISQAMAVDRILRLEYVQKALQGIGKS